MLAIQSGIAKYYSLYTLGAVGFQTPGTFFYSPGTNTFVILFEVLYYTFEICLSKCM